MRKSQSIRLATIFLLTAVTANAVYSQSTKSKKSSTGDQGASASDQSGGDGTDDGSGSTGDKSGGKGATKSDAKSTGDTSKTGFDDGTYAEATAITYKAMQSIAAGVAAKRDPAVKAFIVFDPTSFANIAQYRIQFPQVVLLRKSLCGALANMDKEIKAEKKARQDANQVIPRQTYGADASLPGLSPAGQIVDLAQKVLTMMQTTTTITGASVNVTDEALVADVAANLHKLDPNLTIYYPGEFLLPDIGESDINTAMNADWCQNAPDLGASHHIVAEVVRLGVARQEAATRYQLLTAALDKYNTAMTANPKRASADQATSTDGTGTIGKDKKKKQPTGTAGASPAPTTTASDATQTNGPTAQEKKDALDQFFTDTGFTDAVKATGYQTNLKSYMDAYDALLTSLSTPDTKAQTMFSRLVIAERLDSILRPSPVPDPTDATKTIPSPVVNVLIVKWLRAGALNKTRKNLFFLGQRNYYAGGATALYVYFDSDQKMLASGTITNTSPYVHDKDFDKKKPVPLIDLTTP
jgi:hypothetical protein